ncbi:MAG: hypothetical protein K2N51_08770 [Lachnospiraceae bacterium]|nr:hypothetical protein [Lachnospiraceae bacterium]
MEDIRKQVEAMIGDTPKHLGLVVSLDDISKDALSDWEKEEFNEIVSDLKKIGIKLEINMGNLVMSYDKGKEGIINWNDYPIRVPEDKDKVQIEQVQNDISDVSEGKLDWHIIHEANDDNGQPVQWSAKLPNGKFLWIDKETEGYVLYDTHITDASPVSVSETLEEAKESGEDYKEDMEQENLNAVWEIREMLDSPVFNLCEQGINEKDILYKLAQQYSPLEKATKTISASMEKQIVQQAFENKLNVKSLSDKLKKYSGDPAFALVQESIENYFEWKKGQIQNALELYKNCVKSAFDAGFSIDNVSKAIDHGVLIYDEREVDIVSYGGYEDETLEDIDDKIASYREEKYAREENEVAGWKS